MRTRLIKLAILAGFGLALAFALSCSGENNEGGNDNPGAEISSSGGILDSLSFAGVSSSRSSSSGVSSSSGIGESASSALPSSSSAEVSSSRSSSSGVSSSSGIGESSSSVLPNSSSSYDPPVLMPNPDPPAGIAWQVNSTTSVSLGWGAVSGATGYYIYRSESLDGPYARVGTSETTSYTDNGLSEGTTYYYKVAAYNSGGEGSQSSYVSATTTYYTIAYNANGDGDNWAPANQTKTHNVALTLSGSVPTRAGYVFDNWNTSANGSGTSYAPGASYADNASVTLYAQWTANTYTVTYNANDGNGAPANQTKIHDVALTLSNSVPTRICYVFDSWNTSANGGGTSYASGASYTANASVTLYAQWNPKTGIVNGPSVSYGGETYESVVICEQTWLKYNLNYAAEGSKCYGNSEDNCAIYGRLYDWATAMALPSECNSTFCSSQVQPQHQGICPPGWHIPSDAEWETLINYVDYVGYDGTKLKATSGWNDFDGRSGNGTDEFGFSALPGGIYRSTGFFHDVGNYGYWLSASEYDSYYAYNRRMYSSGGVEGNYYGKSYYLLSVRCLQD